MNRPTTVTWHLIGENAEAMACDELLPRDWRTKAKALRCWTHLAYQPPRSLHYLHLMEVHHGVRCWTPPDDDYYGGEDYDWVYYDWFSEPVDGWVQLQDCCHLESDDDFDDVIVIDLDHRNDEPLANVRTLAAPEIHLVSAGEGKPWWSRVIGPATIVVL